MKFFPRGNGVGALSVYLECSKEMPTPDKETLETEFKVLRGPPDAVLSDSQPDIHVQLPQVEDSAEWFENYKKTYADAGHVSEPVDSSTTSESRPDWRISAQIGVILYNPKEPRTGWMQSSCHQFNAHNLDWGWTNFHGPWDQIHRRQRGQRQALLRDDTLAFDAYIRVFDDPTKALWWHSSDSEPVWDSLSLTGYRPIGDSVINHSAEVAGLAAWVHLAPFRKIVQSVDILEHLSNCDVKPRPLCQALQDFLWRLRHQPGSAQYVETDKVTSTLRNLHEFSADVTEFWERLRRTLELELAGTGAAEEFARVFDSPSVAVDNASASQEDTPINALPSELITSIKVSADQANTVQGAVQHFLEQKPGRWALPPILHVELSRQRFDHASGQWKMLYNRVDLTEVLNVAPYVVDGQCGEYDLYGFIVHRGRRTSGKFFSILRPGGPGTKWLAFDDGSDNRVECLTRKAALESHVGLPEHKLRDANDKTGHDVAVAVLYVRHDVVRDYLPGPLEPWNVPARLNTYLQTGCYPPPVDADEGNPEVSVQVEVYSVPDFDEKLGSLFDTYDLMSLAKQTNNVMYLTLPQATPLADLRRKIAFSKSNDSDQISPARVRLWKVGQTKDLLGATLVFHRLSTLNDTLENDSEVVRFWLHIVSEPDATLFAMPDPPATPMAVEDKPEESVEVNSASDSDEERDATPSGAGASGDTPVPPPPADDSTADVTMAEAANNTTANDSQQMEIEAAPVLETEAPSTEQIPSPNEADVPATADVAQDTDMEDSPDGPQTSTLPAPTTENSTEVSAPAELEVMLPVPHIYYFIQIFDAHKQTLRVAGSYLSRVEENITAAVRKHIGWPEDKDCLIWARVDGTSITAVSPAESFWTPVRDGICFIVGEKLTKDQYVPSS
jgi:hypothetical protein